MATIKGSFKYEAPFIAFATHSIGRISPNAVKALFSQLKNLDRMNTSDTIYQRGLVINSRPLPTAGTVHMAELHRF